MTMDVIGDDGNIYEVSMENDNMTDQSKNLMNIYELRPKKFSNGNPMPPWDPWYDCCFGMVVVASSEDEARKIASESDATGSEGRDVWLSIVYTTCEIIDTTIPRLVMEDVAYA